MVGLTKVKGGNRVDDKHFMSLALSLAKSATGQTSPNPMVGAVVVKDGQIAGMGAHLRAGEAHAEVHALNMAGERAKGATMYVTLEPCSHHGRTPPCADAVLRAGVSRVVIAMLDPNPQVAGRGAARLKDAGVEVITGVMEKEAQQLNEVFFHYISTGRPFVTIKTASTLDGKTATSTGDSRWISGVKAREEVHQLRHQSDAILVGINTVLADDPALTARLHSQGKQPVRIILDRSLRIPLSARLVTDKAAPTWIYTTAKAPAEKVASLQAQGVEVILLGEEVLSIHAVLDSLGQRGITSLLVEGGAEVNGSFLQARAMNKVISYVSCKLIGGRTAPTSFGGDGLELMNDAVLLERMQVEQIDEHDVRIVGYPRWLAN